MEYILDPVEIDKYVDKNTVDGKLLQKRLPSAFINAVLNNLDMVHLDEQFKVLENPNFENSKYFVPILGLYRTVKEIQDNDCMSIIAYSRYRKDETLFQLIANRFFNGAPAFFNLARDSDIKDLIPDFNGKNNVSFVIFLIFFSDYADIILRKTGEKVFSLRELELTVSKVTKLITITKPARVNVYFKPVPTIFIGSDNRTRDDMEFEYGFTTFTPRPNEVIQDYNSFYDPDAMMFMEWELVKDDEFGNPTSFIDCKINYTPCDLMSAFSWTKIIIDEHGHKIMLASRLFRHFKASGEPWTRIEIRTPLKKYIPINVITQECFWIWPWELGYTTMFGFDKDYAYASDTLYIELEDAYLTSERIVFDDIFDLVVRNFETLCVINHELLDGQLSAWGDIYDTKIDVETLYLEREHSYAEDVSFTYLDYLDIYYSRAILWCGDGERNGLKVRGRYLFVIRPEARLEFTTPFNYEDTEDFYVGGGLWWISNKYNDFEVKPTEYDEDEEDSLLLLDPNDYYVDKPKGIWYLVREENGFLISDETLFVMRDNITMGESIEDVYDPDDLRFVGSTLKVVNGYRVVFGEYIGDYQFDDPVVTGDVTETKMWVIEEHPAEIVDDTLILTPYKLGERTFIHLTIPNYMIPGNTLYIYRDNTWNDDVPCLQRKMLYFRAYKLVLEQGVLEFSSGTLTIQPGKTFEEWLTLHLPLKVDCDVKNGRHYYAQFSTFTNDLRIDYLATRQLRTSLCLYASPLITPVHGLENNVEIHDDSEGIPIYDPLDLRVMSYMLYLTHGADSTQNTLHLDRPFSVDGMTLTIDRFKIDDAYHKKLFIEDRGSWYIEEGEKWHIASLADFRVIGFSEYFVDMEDNFNSTVYDGGWYAIAETLQVSSYGNEQNIEYHEDTATVNLEDETVYVEDVTLYIPKVRESKRVYEDKGSGFIQRYDYVRFLLYLPLEDGDCGDYREDYVKKIEATSTITEHGYERS